MRMVAVEHLDVHARLRQASADFPELPGFVLTPEGLEGLDEPEAHLHPRLQGEMAHWVSTLIVKQFGAQVIMATHAVEIINRLAMRDDAVLLRVDRSSPSATVLRGTARDRGRARFMG